MRQRLNRDVQFNDDFRRKHLVNEYGNYEKYENNTVKLDYDEGKESTSVDKSYENYINLIKRLPTKEADNMKQDERNTIDDMLTSQEIGHTEFSEKYF
jgi:hypothetical protein